MAQRISVDGSVAAIRPANEAVFTLEEMQAIVGGYIEIVPIAGHDLVLVINEKGKLLHLPVNLVATSILRGAYRQSRDWIAGTALLAKMREVDEADWEEVS